ncbi:hypothetical protein ACIHAA_24995 [Streptomyces sp. NPDC052040]|uniref:hypothetical protein n=1 Tax=unclassified Streptomyces TaxID=2593676 RepID=UPI0037D7A05C
MNDQNRGRHPFEDDSGHLRDMTEETLGAQEQERQERQHRLEERRPDRRKDTEPPSAYPRQEDDYYL